MRIFTNICSSIPDGSFVRLSMLHTIAQTVESICCRSMHSLRRFSSRRIKFEPSDRCESQHTEESLEAIDSNATSEEMTSNDVPNSNSTIQLFCSNEHTHIISLEFAQVNIQSGMLYIGCRVSVQVLLTLNVPAALIFSSCEIASCINENTLCSCWTPRGRAQDWNCTFADIEQICFFA